MARCDIRESERLERAGKIKAAIAVINSLSASSPIRRQLLGILAVELRSTELPAEEDDGSGTFFGCEVVRPKPQHSAANDNGVIPLQTQCATLLTEIKERTCSVLGIDEKELRRISQVAEDLLFRFPERSAGLQWMEENGHEPILYWQKSDRDPCFGSSCSSTPTSSRNLDYNGSDNILSKYGLTLMRPSAYKHLGDVAKIPMEVDSEQASSWLYTNTGLLSARRANIGLRCTDGKSMSTTTINSTSTSINTGFRCELMLSNEGWTLRFPTKK